MGEVDGARVGARFVVRGHVQGVGFRYFVLRQARLLQVRGWVRNLPDATVEAQAWAEAATLQTFESALKEGPGHARVDAVERSALNGPGPSGEFRIA